MHIAIPPEFGNAARLAAIIRKHPDLVIVPRGPAYGHMGATITDAMLQAGMRYQTQVWPRVQHVIATYPEATTSRAFYEALTEHGAMEVVRMRGRKATWVLELTRFLVDRQIATEADL